MNLRKKINKIKGDRLRAVGLAEYKINWLNFSSKHDSWVSEKDLNCDEIIQSYLWGKAVRGVIYIHLLILFLKNTNLILLFC